MITFIMNRKFFSKIFISTCLVSITGIFAMAFLYQHYFKQTLIEQETARVQSSISQAGLNLDNHLNRIVGNVYYFFYYSNLGSRLLSMDRSEQEEALASFRLQYSSEIESVMFLVRDDAADEETLVFDDDLSRVREQDYREHEWYRAYRDGNLQMWSAPSEDHLFYQDTSIRTLYLTLSQYDASGREGVLVVRINSKLFSDAFRLLADTGLAIEVTDAHNRIVYASVPPVPTDELVSYAPMNATLNYSGFHVNAFIDKRYLLDKVYRIQSIQPYVYAVVLLITLAVSLVLSLTLVRPVKKLLHLMKQVEMGDLQVRFSSKYMDEVGVLGRNFNNMLSNLSELIEQIYTVRMEKVEAEMKQKDATLLAMQNQINPHFLYNTLEVINCQAILHEAPSISRMSKALADFFRYPIDNQEIEVSLRTEVEHVETYLAIQSERYPDIEIDLNNVELEPFSSYPIVKLTLQPIVENAFRYAFTGDRDYYLKIYGEETETGYALYVEDNGQGMEELAATALNRAFEGEASAEADDEGGRRGIGLLNVHRRIRMRYGPPYGLTVLESVAGGVTVRISLPKEGLPHANAYRG